MVSILKENQWFYKWKRCGADRSIPSVGFSYTSLRSRDQLVRLNLFQCRNRGNEMTAVSLIVRVRDPSLLRLSGIPFQCMVSGRQYKDLACLRRDTKVIIEGRSCARHLLAI